MNTRNKIKIQVPRRSLKLSVVKTDVSANFLNKTPGYIVSARTSTEPFPFPLDEETVAFQYVVYVSTLIEDPNTRLRARISVPIYVQVIHQA
jgi:hypothetical protein